MYLCTYFVPKLPYGGSVLIVTLLKIRKVSKSILLYFNKFCKMQIGCDYILQINTVGHMTIFYPK